MVINSELALGRNVDVGKDLVANHIAIGLDRVTQVVSLLIHDTIVEDGNQLAFLHWLKTHQALIPSLNVTRITRSARIARIAASFFVQALDWKAFHVALGAIPTLVHVNSLLLEVRRHESKVLVNKRWIAIEVKRHLTAACLQAAFALDTVNQTCLRLQEAVVIGELFAWLNIAACDYIITKGLVCESYIWIARMIEQSALIVVLLVHERDRKSIEIVVDHLRKGADKVV